MEEGSPPMGGRRLSMFRGPARELDMAGMEAAGDGAGAAGPIGGERGDGSGATTFPVELGGLEPGREKGMDGSW
jgi:hypothetical protein